MSVYVWNSAPWNNSRKHQIITPVNLIRLCPSATKADFYSEQQSNHRGFHSLTLPGMCGECMCMTTRAGMSTYVSECVHRAM